MGRQRSVQRNASRRCGRPLNVEASFYKLTHETQQFPETHWRTSKVLEKEWGVMSILEARIIIRSAQRRQKRFVGHTQIQTVLLTKTLVVEVIVWITLMRRNCGERKRNSSPRRLPASNYRDFNETHKVLDGGCLSLHQPTNQSCVQSGTIVMTGKCWHC
jgi:hypothetical protein